MSKKAPKATRTDALETLLKKVFSKSFKVSRAAQQALACTQDPRTMPRLLELLNEKLHSGDQVVWLIETIGLRCTSKELAPDEIQPVIRTFLELADSEENVAVAALGWLPHIQPVPAKVIRAFHDKLESPSARLASAAVTGLTSLPPESRAKQVPLLLDHLQRFEGESEWCEIIKCLPPHFARYRRRIESALRGGLKKRHVRRRSILEIFPQIGPAAAALVPDVLAYIGRQEAFTNEEPHLIHLDPEGKEAIPGLIRLLRHRKETVRYQAASELEAYGARAKSAIPALTKLANSRRGQKLRFDADAAQQALKAIQRSPASGGSEPKRSDALQRVLGLVDRVITDE
jgi:HEAT repeat protein